jgi:3-phenylpropionate/trans-cinnamate dioxygenase ferredoxin reductase subunit
MTAPRTLLIVGGGLAAAEAAKTLRAEGYDDRLVVVTEEQRAPYVRPPLT